MLPPAPVVFSTTTVCPRLCVIRAAMILAIVSVGPPAENGTTSVTARVGKFCAPTAPAKNARPRRTIRPIRMAHSPLLAFREFKVGLAEALDEDAHEGLVEGHLAGIGGGAQGLGLDLEDGDRLGALDGGGAPAGGAGEVEDLAEAAAVQERAQGLVHQRDLHLALDQDVEALPRVALADDD